MSLFVRLVRALWIFGIIFQSYMVLLGVYRLVRRIERDPETDQEQVRVPGWLRRWRTRVDDKNARRLLRGMLRLRGVYIKLGQVLSIMGGFLPRVYTVTLETLQDQVPPQSFRKIAKAFEQSLGKLPHEAFRDIDETPLAAASLGQVHAAHLEDGRKVAVKVLYPGIRDVVRTDMKVIRLALKVYKWFFPVQNLDSAYEALVDLLRRETDYLHEASCMERMAKNFEDKDDILFPEVVHELTTKDVLTMTYMEGIKITRLEQLEQAGIDRHAVAIRLVQSFYRGLFVDRFFHADPHPGNFLVQPGPAPDEPRLVVLDFGAISEVKQRTVDGMIDVLQGFFEHDNNLVLEGVAHIGFHAEAGNRALVEKTVITYFQKLLKVKDRTAGALMRAKASELEKLADPEVQRSELRELMRSIHYPDGWFYVERASVLMFWLAGQIDPDLDTLEVGFPYVMPLLADRTRKRSEHPESLRA
jgi:predicted unusual protein kinase regulating ubiquinone biosynthesis (AarF/ABC1/UbiB family)